MKCVIFSIFLMFFASSQALAQTPCPSSEGEVKPQPSENCKPTFVETAPVKFVFPDDEKREDKNKIQDSKYTGEENYKETKNDRILPETCHYTAYAWDTKKGRSTNHFKVSKTYAEVTDSERDPNVPACSVCLEDQVAVDTSAFGLKTGKIYVCHVYAERVKQALSEIAASGEFDIEKLEGYRPGKTRGPVDSEGLRTVWSQHSFGTAIDINAHRNAIYTKCPDKVKNSAKDVKTCKRGIGGDYQPEKYPRVSIVKDGVVYRIMTRFWKWGGEIDGQTKDIMHFSVTGY